jgi:hypothetical protein
MIDVDDDLREALASYAHGTWSEWMKYMFEKSELTDDGCVIILKDLVERWVRQSETPYNKLSEKEKVSDLKEADQIMWIYGSKDKWRRYIND